MTYQCPKCGRYGMEWDGRAKALLCYYKDCNHVIRMKGQKKTPTENIILTVIEQEKKELKKL